MVERIIPAPRGALEHQERITHRLLRSCPILEQVENTEALLRMIGEDLGIQVGLVSEGPTAVQKYERHVNA